MNQETQRLMDAVRSANGDCTDYRIARLLGVMPSRTTAWRHGTHMSDEYAWKAAELAGLDPVEAVLRVTAEREGGRTAEAVRAVLARLSHAASILLALLLGVGLVGMPRTASAAEVSRPFAGSIAVQPVRVCYILRKMIMALRRALARALLLAPEAC